MRGLDDDIRIVESRLARERQDLAALADRAGERAREAVRSPHALATAVAVGFVLGDALRRRGRRTGPARKVGLAGLLTGAAWSAVRHRYGSPIAIAQLLWTQAARRRARAARPDASVHSH